MTTAMLAPSFVTPAAQRTCASGEPVVMCLRWQHAGMIDVHASNTRAHLLVLHHIFIWHHCQGALQPARHGLVTSMWLASGFHLCYSEWTSPRAVGPIFVVRWLPTVPHVLTKHVPHGCVVISRSSDHCKGWTLKCVTARIKSPRSTPERISARGSQASVEALQTTDHTRRCVRDLFFPWRRSAFMSLRQSACGEWQLNKLLEPNRSCAQQLMPASTPLMPYSCC